MLSYFCIMKKGIIVSGLITFMIFAGCKPVTQSNSQDSLLQAVTWYQQSAEMKAIYIQSYNWAERILKERIGQGAEKTLAVVLDIDETVLDNSPQAAQQIIDGMPYNQEMWDEWCQLKKAEALPGVLEFTREAIAMGVEVFYISNRGIHLLDVTLENLKSAGLPNADAEHVLLKTDSSAKDERRARVSQSHEVVLLIGDNLGDFSGIFDDRMDGSDREKVLANAERFGYEYIILPNPLYGGWEKPFRGDSPEAGNLNKKEALHSFRH